jgi:hypothetical protein
MMAFFITPLVDAVNGRVARHADPCVPHCTDSQRERMTVQYKVFSGFGRRSGAPGTPVRRADAVERHRFGIEWIRCPGTTRVMRVAELTVSREYPPSRDGVERHAQLPPESGT